MTNSSQTPRDGYAPRLKRLQKLSTILDEMILIPGTKAGIGLDSLVGLLPVGGDILGLIFSSYIIMEASQMGVSKVILRKMIINVIIDFLVGTLPILGDFFDFAWKANIYNLELLEEHLKQSSYQQ
ncbi:DUF4112 domain-containing protein [Anabaena sp. FACHB-1237]|uniref:DUF4112 domain-containing protein n=1 Tax=Anabaena sp. FACHB-1237 TaxID=2692769 RepID=UPI001681BA73|nr:DUF4112 domain-containing protein [Anabaena sp. FACHB-1237]MBD2138830.1 DUF4112 domain-containing protein [Anabaena sp. FACHB-1237]